MQGTTGLGGEFGSIVLKTVKSWSRVCNISHTVQDSVGNRCNFVPVIVFPPVDLNGQRISNPLEQKSQAGAPPRIRGDPSGPCLCCSLSLCSPFYRLGLFSLCSCPLLKGPSQLKVLGSCPELGLRGRGPRPLHPATPEFPALAKSGPAGRNTPAILVSSFPPSTKWLKHFMPQTHSKQIPSCNSFDLKLATRQKSGQKAWG